MVVLIGLLFLYLFVSIDFPHCVECLLAQFTLQPFDASAKTCVVTFASLLYLVNSIMYGSNSSNSSISR